MPMPDQEQRSIPQINSLVRSLVEQETINYPFWVTGFISRYSQSDRGHIYFDLSDQDYSISCMLPERQRGHIDFDLTKGMEVAVFGAIRVYEKQAKVQLEVEQVRLINHEPFVLDVTRQEQLVASGCWPPQHKPLPQLVQRIGLITSKHSQAREDFYGTFYKEGGQAEIGIVDVRVGGQRAPEQISRAIERLNRENNVDVIALVRGGGRAEELAIFNDLQIARAICQSTIPVLTGIGHHQDDTLADQMADFSAITPTAAALRLAKLAQGPGMVRPAQSAQQISLTTVIIVVLVFAVVVLILMQLSQAAPGA